jgi:glycosyltransferase involved in cell wall biosynthesis
MKISVIVPAYNEEKILRASLAAIRKAAEAFAGLAQWELIVCDNNSTDRTAEIAHTAGANVIFEPINQISRARNRGASVATGDWLIFVDADSFPTRELFARTLQRMLDPRCAGGGCLLRLDETEAMSGLLLNFWNLSSRILHWAAGSFVFCDARLFRELNGFSERLFASEEIDFCRRLKRLARAQRRRLTIITDARLVTSARKMHLYTKSEHLWFLLKAGLRPGRILTSREQCAIWYNGRR